jgi:hypothetical protein
VASTAGVQATDASSIPGSYSCLSPGLDPNKFRLPLTQEPQREYDAPVAYGAMDRPGDLTKDAI